MSQITLILNISETQVNHMVLTKFVSDFLADHPDN
jgi:hypothetical protein